MSKVRETAPGAFKALERIVVNDTLVAVPGDTLTQAQVLAYGLLETPEQAAEREAAVQAWLRAEAAWNAQRAAEEEAAEAAAQEEAAQAAQAAQEAAEAAKAAEEAAAAQAAQEAADAAKAAEEAAAAQAAQEAADAAKNTTPPEPKARSSRAKSS